MTGETVPLDTGDVGRIERLHGSSDHVYLTCPERSGACAYQHGPNRPDDFPLPDLLASPYCVDCGCSLVIVSRADYEGPEDKFRDLDEKGSPLVA